MKAGHRTSVLSIPLALEERPSRSSDLCQASALELGLVMIERENIRKDAGHVVDNFLTKRALQCILGTGNVPNNGTFLLSPFLNECFANILG